MRGLSVPWVYARRVIAQRWGIPPPDVEDYPHQEIDLELELSALEAEYQPKQKPQQQGRR